MAKSMETPDHHTHMCPFQNHAGLFGHFVVIITSTHCSEKVLKYILECGKWVISG